MRAASGGALTIGVVGHSREFGCLTMTSPGQLALGECSEPERGQLRPTRGDLFP